MEMTALVKDDKLIVYLSGEIDHHSAHETRESIDRLIITHRPKIFIFDLQGVAFMDSSGLGLVLGRYKKVKELGSEMYLSNASERTSKILKMAGVDKIIKNIEHGVQTRE